MKECISVPMRRLAKAVALTALLVFGVPAVDAVADSGGARAGKEVAGKSAGSGQSPLGIDSGVLIGDGDVYGLLARLEELSTSKGANLPPAFEREVRLPSRYRDLRSSEDGAVVGCIVDGPSKTVAEEVRSLMEAAGWCEVPLGSVEGFTFVKFFGECRWALVTCTQVGGSTNAVYRCVYR